MKKIPYILFIIIAVALTTACSKEDDDVQPQDPVNNGGNPTDTTNNSTDTSGNSNVTEVDVFGLHQNHIKTANVGEDRLYITSIGGYSSGGDDYFNIHLTGENRHLIDITIKGSELKVGNYKLKKFKLGSDPSDGEAVVHVAVVKNGSVALMDVETSDDQSFSITKNAEGFFVIKMAPLTMTNRNSWDPVVTEAISFHILTNHKANTLSDDINGALVSDFYDYRNTEHSKSGQLGASVNLRAPAPRGKNNAVGIRFVDYDLTVNNIAKQTVTLSKSKIKALDDFSGTVPKGIHMSFKGDSFSELYTQNHSLDQDIDFELTPKYLIINYTDVEFIHTSDPSKKVIASGQIKMAR